MDALGEWGSHNSSWRAGREIRDSSDGVDFALTYYSELVSRILAAYPFGCARAELLAEDLPNLVLHDKTFASVYATAIEKATNRSGEYVRDMAAAEVPVVGPLTCTCRSATVDGGLQLYPPFVVFDGWHRGAAWILHGKAGKVYPLSTNLILTKNEVRPSTRLWTEGA